jgi:hypothetical protein
MKFTNFELVEYDDKHHIVFLRDLDQCGMTITNNAEAVYRHVRTYWGAVRVVYQDTMGNWDEIIEQAGSEPGEWQISFAPWQGLFMDTLKRGL